MNYKYQIFGSKDTDNGKLALRVFFYDTPGRAKSRINSYFMWLNDMIHYYPEILEDPKLPHPNNRDAYNKFITNALLSQLEVVKVEMTVNEHN